MFLLQEGYSIPLKAGSGRFTSENFFRASAKNFWSFMVISAILYLIVILLIIVVIVVPVSSSRQGRICT